MNALFIDSDPVVRGVLHCMATMAGLDHAIVSSAREALLILRGQKIDARESWSVVEPSQDADRIGVVATEIDLPDVDGMDLATLIRREFPETMIFAHTYAESINGGERFDRVFFKPHAADAVVRAALGVLGTESEQSLFCQMIPAQAVDTPAA